MHRKRGMETPCGGCEYQPPPVGPDNALADRLYLQAFDGARDGNGALQFAALVELLRASGLDEGQTRMTLRKVFGAERLFARKRARDHERRMSEMEAKAKRNGRARRP